jgi:hypothetical protein
VTKVYRMTVLVIDHDNLGEENVHFTVEKYAALDARVVSMDTKEVDDIDEHPINHEETWENAYQRLFELGHYATGFPPLSTRDDT